MYLAPWVWRPHFKAFTPWVLTSSVWDPRKSSGKPRGRGRNSKCNREATFKWQKEACSAERMSQWLTDVLLHHQKRYKLEWDCNKIFTNLLHSGRDQRVLITLMTPYLGSVFQRSPACSLHPPTCCWTPAYHLCLHDPPHYRRRRDLAATEGGVHSQLELI